MNRKEIIVNPDGQVVPCCYFANPLMFWQWLKPEKEKNDDPKAFSRYMMDTRGSDPLLRAYVENVKQLNIYDNDIEDILEHDWFKQLYESWDDPDKTSPICIRNCSVKE